MRVLGLRGLGLGLELGGSNSAPVELYYQDGFVALWLVVDSMFLDGVGMAKWETRFRFATFSLIDECMSVQLGLLGLILCPRAAVTNRSRAWKR